MTKTRVLRIVVEGNIGGLGTRLIILNDLLDREQYELHFAFLTTGGECAKTLRKSNFYVHELGLTRSNLSTRAVLALFKLLKKVKPHIVHSSTGTANFYSGIAATLSKTPVLIGEEISVPNRRLRARLKHACAHALSTKVIGVSRATTNYLIQKEFCSSRKVVTLYNGYPIHFDELPTRRQIEVSDKLKLIMVSRLSPEKNHTTLFKALDILVREKNLRIELTVVGDGPERTKLMQHVESHNLQPYVNFTGFRSDIPELLSAHDLYLLPSTSEGFGIALAEAMRAGIPVLGSNVGGIPEVLEGYPINCLLQPLDVNGWVRAILDFRRLSAEERQLLSDKGIELSRQRFSSKSYIRNLDSLYQTSLSSLN